LSDVRRNGVAVVSSLCATVVVSIITGAFFVVRSGCS
jgi:hypothetical protein